MYIYVCVYIYKYVCVYMYTAHLSVYPAAI